MFVFFDIEKLPNLHFRAAINHFEATTMKCQFFTILILAFLFSCGQKNDSIEGNKETVETAIVGSFSSRPDDTFISQGNNCSYANQVSSLGIGLIIAPTKFEIYNDSLLRDAPVSWDMYENGSNIHVCAKFFGPDYGIMHFVCIGKTKKSYKILVNYSDIKYLPITKDYNFLTWGEYISQSFGIRRITSDEGEILNNHPLRIQPNDNADTLAIPKGHELFCPMEIKDDWVKVRYDCFYNDENNSFEGEPCHHYIDKCNQPLTGWLRWRKENQLLIDIFLMP